jgi:polyisoprenoid-binding protein YceI
VVVPVTLKQAGGTTTATGTFTIKRLDFKIGEGEWADTSTVANNVEVHFKLAVTGVARSERPPALPSLFVPVPKTL